MKKGSKSNGYVFLFAAILYCLVGISCYRLRYVQGQSDIVKTQLEWAEEIGNAFKEGFDEAQTEK